MAEDPDRKPRAYDSTNRREAALRRRRDVMDASRQAFLLNGYAASTVPSIARTAGVAVDTVYALVGPKPQLFRLLVESAISGEDGPVPALEREYVRQVQAEQDPRRKLLLYARAVATLQERLAPLLSVLREAAQAEPDLASMWKDIGARRAANMLMLATEIDTSGTLRRGLSVEAAADIIWSMNSSEFYLLLVLERRWTPRNSALGSARPGAGCSSTIPPNDSST